MTDACPHPTDQRDEAISHLGDPDWAYCWGCLCVLRRHQGVWTAQPRNEASA